jgi:hypothetical protein
MSQQASVGGPREPEARASGHLSMEHAPLRRKGKGGEAPQLHRPLSSLDRKSAAVSDNCPGGVAGAVVRNRRAPRPPPVGLWSFRHTWIRVDVRK